MGCLCRVASVVRNFLSNSYHVIDLPSTWSVPYERSQAVLRPIPPSITFLFSASTEITTNQRKYTIHKAQTQISFLICGSDDQILSADAGVDTHSDGEDLGDETFSYKGIQTSKVSNLGSR
jgi:hypothetical protein